MRSRKARWLQGKTESAACGQRSEEKKKKKKKKKALYIRRSVLGLASALGGRQALVLLFAAAPRPARAAVLYVADATVHAAGGQGRLGHGGIGRAVACLQAVCEGEGIVGAGEEVGVQGLLCAGLGLVKGARGSAGSSGTTRPTTYNAVHGVWVDAAGKGVRGHAHVVGL